MHQLLTDDQNRLWVGGVGSIGEMPSFDVFTADGEFLGAVRVPFEITRYARPAIRNGRFYAIAQDSLDVPYVVAGAVPALRARR